MLINSGRSLCKEQVPAECWPIFKLDLPAVVPSFITAYRAKVFSRGDFAQEEKIIVCLHLVLGGPSRLLQQYPYYEVGTLPYCSVIVLLLDLQGIWLTRFYPIAIFTFYSFGVRPRA